MITSSNKLLHKTFVPFMLSIWKWKCSQQSTCICTCQYYCNWCTNISLIRHSLSIMCNFRHFYSAQLAFPHVTWCWGCCTSSQFVPQKGLFLGSSDQFNPLEIEITNHSLLSMAFRKKDELNLSNVHVQTDEMADTRMSIIISITYVISM